MRREYTKWHSPALGRDMEMLVFGHAGARVLAFPTSMGRFYQWEDFSMVNALSGQIERGDIQLFCVDSVDEESWYARWRPPAERALRQSQYDRYLADEVLPYTKTQNANPYLITTGASFGAYHAANFAFRHPAAVDRVIGLSGLYDIAHFADGYSDDDVYFNNPMAYIANEHEPERLAALRHQDIILATGHDDPNRPSNERLSTELWAKDIWHALRIWDGWAHDWPYWHQMIQHYIGGHD
ncbi:MAG TPA: alpha/beta hydrolase-fold protein [Ktedonobacterales bacterium]